MRYAVMAEVVQDPYANLTLIAPTQHARTPREAARNAVEASPYSWGELVGEELLVFELSDEPAAVFKARDLAPPDD